MKTLSRTLFLAGSLALVLYAGLGLACPSPLECANFTQTDKITDCNYALSQGLNYTEEQDVLCNLWDENYYQGDYQQQNYPALQPNLNLQANAVTDGRLVLAGKIILFLLFNYFLLSLTKSSVVKKWFSAV